MVQIFQIAAKKELSFSRLFIVAWRITDICGKIIRKFLSEKKEYRRQNLCHYD